VGVPGELCVGGVGVGRGYRNDARRTADAFRPDPFSRRAGARLYHTGDLVRWRADSTLTFLGRLDRQVKLRGFRIELGEVEAAISAHPAVHEALAIVRDDAAGEATLVCYVVSEPSHEIDASDVQEFVREQLPIYMVPSAIVFLDRFPVTSHGKVDLKALPAFASTSSATFQEPRTLTERALSAIWAELLGVQQIGSGDDFFQRGGHSLRAVQLVARIRLALGIELPLRTVFERPMLAAQAEELDRLSEVALDQLASEIAGLSDDEAAAMLQGLEKS
jgi:aryl carrier-like protein